MRESQSDALFYINYTNMKIKKILFVSILVSASTLCFTQIVQPENSSSQSSAANDSILFVLKVDNKSFEVDPRKNEKLDLASIDPTAIESISVLKGLDAKDTHGNNRQNGVIIISFRNFNVLPKALQTKFSDIDKN
jgi:hypothetical protein